MTGARNEILLEISVLVANAFVMGCCADFNVLALGKPLDFLRVDSDYRSGPSLGTLLQTVCSDASDRLQHYSG